MLTAGVSGRGRWSGLGTAQRAQQQSKQKTVHDFIGLEAPRTILAVRAADRLSRCPAISISKED